MICIGFRCHMFKVLAGIEAYSQGEEGHDLGYVFACLCRRVTRLTARSGQACTQREGVHHL